MAENASFFAGFLYWLAIAFRWFLRLFLLFLVIGVVLGVGALVFNFLRVRKLETSPDGDASPDADLVELDFLAAECDPHQDQTSDSGEDY